MFVHTGRTSAADLSHWLGPLSPAFAAIAAAPEEGPARPGGSGPEHASGAPPASSAGDPLSDEPLAHLRALFHTLNNQLGVILTYAELIEAKAADEGARARATQIVSAAIEALETSKKIRGAVVRS